MRAPSEATENNPRFPAWVYRTGTEPDYRFSFANERTYLAWIRTALALLASGVAVHAIDLPLMPILQTALAITLVVSALVISPYAWWRWATAERAIRQGRPLPSSTATALVAALIVVSAAITLIGTL